MHSHHQRHSYQDTDKEKSPSAANSDCHYEYRGRFSTGRWDKSEHEKFVEALRLYGKDWGKVQQYVGTRSSTQARSHAQKFFQRLDKVFSNKEDVIKQLREAHGANSKYLYDFEDSENESEGYKSSSRGRRDTRREEEKKVELSNPSDDEVRSSRSERHKRFAYANEMSNMYDYPVDERMMHNAREPIIEAKAKPVLENIGYIKETKKEYLEDAAEQTARNFNIIEATDDTFRSWLESDLNTMSFCIMSYNGPSSLVPEDKLLQMHPLGKSVRKLYILDYISL